MLTFLAIKKYRLYCSLSRDITVHSRRRVLNLELISWLQIYITQTNPPKIEINKTKQKPQQPTTTKMQAVFTNFMPYQLVIPAFPPLQLAHR